MSRAQRQPPLFRALSRIRDRSQHQAAVDSFPWRPDELLLSPSDSNFDEAYESSFDTSTRLVLNRTALCPWSVLYQHPSVSVQLVPGRGMGLVASAPIPKHALLLAEEGVAGTREALASWLVISGEQLCGATDVMLESWSPYKNVSREEWNLALCRLRENKFTLPSEDDDGSDGMNEAFVLFRIASRINHSCAPAAARHHHGPTVHVYALRDVNVGDEVTMRYSVEEGHDDMTEFFACGCAASARERARASAREADVARELCCAEAKR